MSTVIKVENLSKQYRLGNVGLGSLSHDINRFWQTRILGREDPYLKIGEENNRETADNSGYVWALRDINFDVQQGEVLGIIGRNGAGKSTLLKILSRTTGPTTGSIKIRGRVASLLEVGTGFHPELTGRENIFLNGAILGMTKAEIRSKFDEIVSFAGVERYVDTPVKRYSSGMYVRLAFAVAAHLEPEILIVDEVLAVGDAEFQKKAIGKMKEVSEGQGRTVLFVSHNMVSIRNLCSRAMLLQNGVSVANGDVNVIVDQYSSLDESAISTEFKNHNSGLKEIFIDSFKINSEIETGKPFEFEVNIYAKHSLHIGFAVGIRTLEDRPLMHIYSGHVGESFELKKGENRLIGRLENLNLGAGMYKLNLWAGFGAVQYDFHESALIISVTEGAIRKEGPVSSLNGYPVISDTKWKLN